MKSSYTFKATAQATDYVRICRENHQARFLVIKSEGVQTLTLVRRYSPEYYKLSRVGTSPTGKVEVPSQDPQRGVATWIIFDGDLSSVLQPKLITTVEVY